ncbi:WYL domain-containing protein [Streptomyces sclerotialus]|uniref:WYL domain-containing protein n=1 Tax=Streptomyces sclerotialus TaxID=1957 RepID=UPI000A4B6E90
MSPRSAGRALPAADAASYMAESVTGHRARHRAVVTPHTSSEDAARRVPPGSGVLEPLPDGRCRLLTGGDALDWLAFRLALLGVAFEVHEPPELIAYLRKPGGRMVAAASGGGPA